MRRPLSEDAFVSMLDGWAGREVAVRVVTEDRELLAICCGKLGTRSEEKHPALFWPLLGAPDHLERPGVYLHHDHFQEAAVHEGGFVLELRQAGVTLSLRRI